MLLCVVIPSLNLNAILPRQSISHNKPKCLLFNDLQYLKKSRVFGQKLEAVTLVGVGH